MDTESGESHSSVVELNRAVAMGMAFGPAAGFAHADLIAKEPRFADYRVLPAVRADFLFKPGCWDEARREFEKAASLTRHERETTLLQRRAQECRTAAADRPS